MVTILVVEDDPDIRYLVSLHLESAGYSVAVAGDGADALRLVSSVRPDLIVSDLDMPNLDGFGLLEAVRTEGEFSAVPVILLTSHPDRDTFRKSMLLGADDFIQKPVNRRILLEAVSARLRRLEGVRKAVAETVSDHAITDATAGRRLRSASAIAPGASGPDNTGGMPVAKLQAFTPTSPMQQMTVKGSVLFADIRRFTAFTEALTGEEVVELLTAFLGEACEPVRQQCGWVVKFLGDGLVAMFEPRPGGGEDHAERALKSALLMVLAARNFSAWLAQRFPGRRLPAFAIGVGVHSGDVVVCNMGGGDGAETTVIGDCVNIASRLEGMTKEYGWSIVASRACASLAGGRIATGRDGRVVPRGKTQSLDVVEITGLAPRRNSSAAQVEFYEALRSAAMENAAIIEAARAPVH